MLMISKKNFLILLILNILLFILIIIGTLLYLFSSEKYIFKKDIDSVVEVKAMTDNVGESFGSGVIMTSDGKVVTNYHVIHYTSLGEDVLFETIQIRFAKDENYINVSLIKYDKDLDLALLQIEGNNKYKAITQSKKSITYGDKVYAIGNSSNYGIGITEGIISVPEVEIEYENKIRLVIQSDITISNGNSGGALVDKNGNLIGITTFRTKDLSGNVNYGFCYSIPLRIINEFLNN